MPKLACDTAISQIGVKEQGNNRGLKVSQYIKTGGGTDGQSWCMYFVYWCYNQSAKYLKIKNPLKRTGSCADQLRYANSLFSGIKVIKTNSLFSKVKVKTGSIAVFKSGNIFTNDIGKLWNGHTGIIEKQIGENSFVIIEGNTNSQGSREGNSVARKHRKINNGKLNLIGIIEV